MQQRHYRQRGAARAQVMQRSQAPWVLGMLTAGSILLLGLSLAHAQTGNAQGGSAQSGPAPSGPVQTSPGQTAPAPVPEVVKPGNGGSASSVPDSGVIAPPSTASSTPVIRPPATGTMPVIPPPGSAGGNTTVVPK